MFSGYFGEGQQRPYVSDTREPLFAFMFNVSLTALTTTRWVSVAVGC